MFTYKNSFSLFTYKRIVSKIGPNVYFLSRFFINLFLTYFKYSSYRWSEKKSFPESLELHFLQKTLIIRVSKVSLGSLYYSLLTSVEGKIRKINEGRIYKTNEAILFNGISEKGRNMFTCAPYQGNKSFSFHSRIFHHFKW